MPQKSLVDKQRAFSATLARIRLDIARPVMRENGTSTGCDKMQVSRADGLTTLLSICPEVVEQAMQLCRKKRCTTAEKKALHHLRYLQKHYEVIASQTQPWSIDLITTWVVEQAENPVLAPLFAEFGMLVFDLSVSDSLKIPLQRYNGYRRLRELAICDYKQGKQVLLETLMSIRNDAAKSAATVLFMDEAADSVSCMTSADSGLLQMYDSCARAASDALKEYMKSPGFFYR